MTSRRASLRVLMDLLLKQELCLQGHTGAMSGLLEPAGGEPLCIYLLREGGAGEGRREVACQWESPEEETKEVGCQWESPEEPRRDAAVQVDLLMQQLSWTRTGEGGWGLTVPLGRVSFCSTSFGPVWDVGVTQEEGRVSSGDPVGSPGGGRHTEPRRRAA